MLFNSFEYVLFLVLTFGAFWALARMRLVRTVLLLVASYIFYMSWNATFIFLIVGSTLVDYWVGLALPRYEKPRTRKLLVLVSLVVNLGLLGVFKYGDFCIRAVTQTLGLAGIHVEPTYMNLVLPVGISFYTFQTLSYTIDVYRKRIEPTRSFIEFATFVSFFPQLVAGPIVRASEFLPQFEHEPRLSTRQVGEGLFLILCGMIKKVAIADFLAANLIDRVFENPGAFGYGEVWVAIFAYTWQLYADFSGYTDIARGSAKLFGFELPENFNRPFTATSPADFWSRWHITLSRWVQDYIYVPLGGSRLGEVRTYANLFLSFFIIGIWHGAGWTFVIFGLWHAIGVTVTRVINKIRGKGELSPAVKWTVTVINLSFFVFHWPIFRSPTVERMWEVYGQMFNFESTAMRVGPWVWAVIIGMTIVHFTPRRWVKTTQEAMVRLPAPAQAVVVACVGAALMYIGAEQAAPFIYFQF